MRCRNHPTDQSSTAGVCASCLRERLRQLIDEQFRANETVAMAMRSRSSEDCWRPEDELAFPRSVSPHVARRKSYNRHRRFYSTPQVGPSSSASCSFVDSKKKHGKFSLFVNLFRSRSDKIDSDATVCSNSDTRLSPPHDSCQVPSSSYPSPSWRSFLPRRHQKQQATGDSCAHACRRPCRISNRGMSPDGGIELEDHLDSGCSSEPLRQGWRRTPVAAVTPGSVRRRRAGHTKSASGLSFCLSPLVRASPSRQWNQKGSLQPEIGVSGSRSRKLADIGRVTFNR